MLLGAADLEQNFAAEDVAARGADAAGIINVPLIMSVDSFAEKIVLHRRWTTTLLGANARTGGAAFGPGWPI